MFRLSRIHPLLPGLIFLFSFSSVFQAQVKVDAARSEWMKGYVKLEHADKADQEGNKLAALQLYREAVVVFEAVRRQFPQWNPSLLNFRIKYCQQKITELDKSVQNEAEGMSRENLLELTAKQAQMMHDNSLKIQQLNTSVSILTESLQRARTEAAKNAAAESDFSTLQTARQELENRCRLLQSKLEKSEADLAEARKQAADKKLLQKLRDETMQQSEQLRESTRQIELLQGNLKTVQVELDKAKLDNERQNRVGTDYEKRLQAATDRMTELTGMLNDLHVQHNALKLKSQQQEVDANFQKESNTRLNNEKKELVAEVEQLRNIRDKFAATQDANQTLRTQVLDGQNRLQESLEKNRFELQKRDEQIEKLQTALNTLRTGQQDAVDALLTAKAEQLAATDRHQQELNRLQQELTNGKDTSDKLRQQIIGANANLEQFRQKLADEQVQSKALLQKIADEEAQSKALRQKLAEEQAQSKALRQQAAMVEAEKTQLAEKVLTEQRARQELVVKLAAAQAEFQQLSSAVQKGAQQGADPSSVELQILRQQITEQAAVAAGLKQELASVAAARAKESAKVIEQTRNLAAAEQARQELAKALAILEERGAEANQEKKRLAEALRISEGNRLLLEKKQQENSGSGQLLQEHTALQTTHAQLITRADQLQQEHTALQAIHAQMKAQADQMQQKYDALQESHALLKTQAAKFQAELTGARGGLQEAAQNLKRSQDYALTLEKQLQQLRSAQKEFSDISKQLQGKDALLSSRDETLRQQAERLAAANALVLTKTDETQSARVELQGLKRKLADMETLNGRLNEQLTGVIRRQADFDRENVDLKARSLEEAKQREELQQQKEKLQQELTAKTALSIRLEKAITEAERKSEELGKQLAAEQQKMQMLQDDLGNSKTKSAAVDGLTSNLIDLQNQLKARTQELAQLKNDLQAGQTQVSVMTEQLKRRDEQVKELAAAKESQAERIWLNRLADLNSKLEQEENRRKALELALIQKEAESRKTASAEPPVSTVSSPVLTNQMPVNRSYSEKEVLINGFLRQALDAEKSQKMEAAVWNYQKILELEPAHLLALKRLGLIAANTGNDDDTVKYLKLAFRYDPDDADVLLALGYAMINLRQPEWAFSYLGRAVALEPANPTLSRLFGGALVDLGWTQAAENQFSKALQLNPKDPHSAFNLAVLCATANPPRMEEAKKWYDQAIRNGAEKDPRLEAEFK